MAWRPTQTTHSPDEKTYSSSTFRGSFPSSTAYTGDVRRHKFDCELGAAAAAYNTGPSYSDTTLSSIRSVLSSPDNCHYYGSKTANTTDRYAATAVLQSKFTGTAVYLPAHEASHVREGAAFLKAHKEDLPHGFYKSAIGLYDNVYDSWGHKVVDKRSFR